MPARSQFAMIPMNFLMPEDRAGYLLSGIWSQLAYQEALRLKNAYCLATSEDSGLFLKTPCVKDFHYLDKTAYVFFTPNETIHGVSWPEVPSTAGNIPLIADMTSCLLSRPIDVSQYACIFAGAQKNIAPAGLTLVIIRDDLVDRIKQNSVAAIFDYRVHIKHKPCYATPPMFSCYFAAKMFTWIKSKGGLEAFLKINNHKAKLLYDYIDDSHFYFSYIKAPYRSMQNISFHLNDSVLEKKFINQAEQAGLLALKGHKLAGGCRASLYNAMPIEGVSALIDFMEKFSALH
jgi:phosphoserine aminotransferase